MGLELPTNGADIGTWGTKLNVALPIIDSHNHTAGQGSLIPAAALDINATVPWNDFGISEIGRLDFTAVAALSTGSKTVFVNAADNELYWRTNGGTNVKLTSGNALNVGAFVGGISGDYAASDARLAYDDATGAYTFKRGSANSYSWARLRAGDLRLSEYNTTETVYTAIKAAAGLASSYDITLPTALPGDQTMMQITAAGQVVFSNALAVNQDVTVSGTGEYNHGDKYISVSPLIAQTISGAGHSFGSTSNAVYTQVSSTGVTHFPIQGWREGARLKSVHVYATGTNQPGVTVWLQALNACAQLPSVQTGGWVGGGMQTSTLTTPNTMNGQGDTIYVRVVSVGATTTNVWSIHAIYDVP
jgi:hypothetical protein